jgi:Na+-translocating ferredoxin:NAD+ oxidoreductase RnfC subunit
MSRATSVFVATSDNALQRRKKSQLACDDCSLLLWVCPQRRSQGAITLQRETEKQNKTKANKTNKPLQSG